MTINSVFVSEIFSLVTGIFKFCSKTDDVTEQMVSVPV